MCHSDLCYVNETSYIGSRYVLKFIYDLSHYTWVYFLKYTSHVFEQFKEFGKLDGKKCGRPIRCLRYDDGGEYVSRKFADYLVKLVLSGIFPS